MPDINNKKIPRKERERRRLRREIIGAASDLFSLQSYEKTTVQQIAERAEISVGTIYNLFDGKEAIFLYLVNMIIEELEAEVQEAAESSSNPVDRILSFFETYLDFCEKQLTSMIVIHHENPVKMHGILKEFFKKQVLILENHFSRAIEEQRLKAENPRLLAVITIGYIHSYAIMIADEEPVAGKEELIDLFRRTLLQSP